MSSFRAPQRYAKRVARDRSHAAEYARLLADGEWHAGRYAAVVASELLRLCDQMATQLARNTAFLASMDILKREERRNVRKGDRLQAQWCVGLQGEAKHHWGA